MEIRDMSPTSRVAVSRNSTGLPPQVSAETFQSSDLPACCRSGQCSNPREILKSMQDRDNEVRQHEQAHLTAAGDLARSGPIFEYKVGPDGRSYVVEGKCMIDAAEIQGDAAGTVEKMKRVQRAALAPGSCLSGADLALAATASAREARALRQMTYPQ